MDSALTNAQQKLTIAIARNREAESAQYCCDASRSQAVGKTKKQVKRWTQFIADHQVLTTGDETDDGESR